MRLLTSTRVGFILKSAYYRPASSFNLAPKFRPSWPCQVPMHRSVRSAYGTSGGPSYEALLLDIGGTLLEPAKPIPETYASFGVKYGVKASLDDISQGFKKSFKEPWPERLRYEGDGKPFWKYAVAIATGCSDDEYFEELYAHFGNAEAWKLAEGAYDCLLQLRSEGVKLAVVSNFDTRLRPLLQDLEVDHL